MAYKKTAKDLAWDRERIRYESEINQLRKYILKQEKEIVNLNEEIEKLLRENQDLCGAVEALSENNLTPAEAIEKMNKNVELCDIMKFLVNGTRGIF